MDDESMVKRMFLGNPGGRRKYGRPRLRWLDWVKDVLQTLGVRSWRKRAKGREECAIILREAMVKLQELYPRQRRSSLVVLQHGGNFDIFTQEGLHEKHAVATWNLRTISAFA
jgi:hypothetical protein